jgi:radical SAM-linked protein
MPTTRIEQGVAQRYRLRYSKLGRSAYLGHLDLVRHLPRIFRRAGLELFYSLGFHPKPELTFGPALGLGIPSLGELLDVSLTDDLEADELLARLRPVSLPGVELLEARRLENNDRALGRVISSSEFAARLPDGAEVAPALERWRSDDTIRTRRDSDKGIARMIDVRQSLRSLAGFEDVAVRARLDWPSGALVRFAVSVSHEGSARPVEVVRALWGEETAAGTDFARLALRATEDADPMHLDVLRRPVAAAQVP